MKNSFLFILGFALTIVGISCVLRFWDAVVIVFQGVIGGLLAVLGLVVLFAASFKRDG